MNQHSVKQPQRSEHPGPPDPSTSTGWVPRQEIEGAQADLFDYAKLRDYLGFGLRAVRRRWPQVLLTFVLVTAVSVVAVIVLPKTYVCEIKIQAQRNTIISNIAGMPQPWDYELPTRAAADLIQQHDNYVSIVHKADLVREWERTKPPLWRLRDGIAKRISGELTPELKEEALINALEQRLAVAVTEDTVTISVEWPDAASAYRIIHAAYENFLDARRYKEIAGVAEAIGLLESRAADSRATVIQELDKLQRLRAARPTKARPAAAAKLAPAPPPPDPELAALRAQLQSKRQVIAQMEEFRRKRIADLSAKLAELKQNYSEFHPAVIDLEQSLSQQEREENPQLAVLRADYKQLEDEYDRRGGAALPEVPLTSAPLPMEAQQLSRSTSEEIEPPEIEQAKADIKLEISRYATVTQKIEAAKLELESQRAAFQYRYGVLRPAALPLSPAKPKKRVVVGAGAVMGILLGMVLAFLLDLRSGVLLEEWQVERMLEVPVIGEVSLR
jgi:uncharacterized protein involved in exopolysaccharide biosynthesis